MESRALMVGLTARVGGPASVLDLDPRHFLQLLEGVVREDPSRAQLLDHIYAEAMAPATSAPAPDRAAERRREIDRAMRAFGA